MSTMLFSDRMVERILWRTFAQFVQVATVEYMRSVDYSWSTQTHREFSSSPGSMDGDPMDDSVYQEAQAVLWDMAEPLLTYEQLLQKTYVEEVNKRKERAVSSEDGCGVVLKRICNYAEHPY
jgi:hypothetical protein